MIVRAKIVEQSFGRQRKVPPPFTFRDDLINDAKYAFAGECLWRVKPPCHL
jgi:hypothetical protein